MIYIMACNGGLFPRLFSTQSSTDLTIPTTVAGTTTVLTLGPIATLSGDEVKLDSMVELQFTTPVATGLTNVTGVSYVLQRSTNGGAFTTLAQLDLDAPLTIGATTTLYPNLTWVDTPGVGTQTYRIVIVIATAIPLVGLTSLTAETRALNALVVREA
jgi:hypothetical protein